MPSVEDAHLAARYRRGHLRNRPKNKVALQARLGLAAEPGALLFGIFNGVGAARADVVDGLCLTPALDAGRTPTAHAMVFERIDDLPTTASMRVKKHELRQLGNGDATWDRQANGYLVTRTGLQRRTSAEAGA